MKNLADRSVSEANGTEIASTAEKIADKVKEYHRVIKNSIVGLIGKGFMKLNNPELKQEISTDQLSMNFFYS